MIVTQQWGQWRKLLTFQQKQIRLNIISDAKSVPRVCMRILCGTSNFFDRNLNLPCIRNVMCAQIKYAPTSRRVFSLLPLSRYVERWWRFSVYMHEYVCIVVGVVVNAIVVSATACLPAAVVVGVTAVVVLFSMVYRYLGGPRAAKWLAWRPHGIAGASCSSVPSPGLDILTRGCTHCIKHAVTIVCEIHMVTLVWYSYVFWGDRVLILWESIHMSVCASPSLCISVYVWCNARAHAFAPTQASVGKPQLLLSL